MDSNNLPMVYRLYTPIHNLLTGLLWLKVRGKHPSIIFRNHLNRIMFQHIFTQPATTVLRTHDNFLIEVPLSDQSAASIIFEKSYSPQETAFFTRLVRLTSGFIDIGANMGYFTLLARQTMGQDYPITLVEPNPRLNELIKKSIEHNNFHNINLVQAAASATEGEAYFLFDDSRTSNGTVIDHPAENTITVRTVGVDQLMNWSQQPKPYLIKVDVEGLEVEVIKGSQNAMEAGAFIMCEVFRDSFEALYRIVTDRSYIMLNWSGRKVTKYEGFRRTDFILIPQENYEQVQQLLHQA